MSDVAQARHEGMHCPVCRVDLMLSERLGVEIDYCPKCRGIWLDRGELDKIIEMSERQAPAAAASQSQGQPAPGFLPPPPQGDPGRPPRRTRRPGDTTTTTATVGTVGTVGMVAATAVATVVVTEATTRTRAGCSADCSGDPPRVGSTRRGNRGWMGLRTRPPSVRCWPCASASGRSPRR